jgi:GxxExxY protein
MREPSDATDDLAHAVIGAAIDVHRLLGPGFLEAVYEEALCVELEMRRIPFERQRRFNVDYKGRVVGKGRLDLLVGDLLVVELKAVSALTPFHHAKAISYLRATGLELALLVNFQVPILKDGIQRVVCT